MKGHKRDPQGEKWAEGLTDDTFKISLNKYDQTNILCIDLITL